MIIREEEGFYIGSYITGPKHNLLYLKLTMSNANVELHIETLPPIGQCNHGSLDKNQITQAVNEGIERANNTFYTNYRAEHIKYSENDTPSYFVYSLIAKRIVEHIEKSKEEKNSQT